MHFLVPVVRRVKNMQVSIFMQAAAQFAKVTPSSVATPAVMTIPAPILTLTSVCSILVVCFVSLQSLFLSTFLSQFAENVKLFQICSSKRGFVGEKFKISYCQFLDLQQ